MINQSNLPSVNRFKFEDFPGAPDWFAQFINQFNLFSGPVYSILNRGVGYQNLVAPQIYKQTILGAAPTVFQFTNPLSIQPSAVTLGNVWYGIPSQHPAVACQVMWHESGNVIYIDDVIGLTPGTMYNLTLVVN